VIPDGGLADDDVLNGDPGRWEAEAELFDRGRDALDARLNRPARSHDLSHEISQFEHFIFAHAA
jgi:hypothetical protein